MPFAACDEAPSTPSRPRPDRLEPGTILDGSKPPVEVAARRYQSLTTVLPRSLFDPTIKVPGSVYKVTHFLNEEADRFTSILGEWQVGVWISPYEIAEQTGLSESTVRNTALRWLQEHDEAALQEIRVPGRNTPATMIWLKWRGPLALEGAVLEFPGVSPPVPEHAPTARKRLRESAPIVRGRIPGEDNKNDDKRGRPSSFSSAARSEPEPAPIEAAPTPSPLDPGISKALETHVPDVIERAEIESRLPRLLAIHPIAWVILAIAAMAKNRATPGFALRTTLGAYLAGIMKKWAELGEPTIALPPGSMPPPEFRDADRQRREMKEAEALEAKRLAAKAKAVEEDSEAADWARFMSLPDPMRLPLEGKVQGQRRWATRSRFFQAECIQAMKEAGL